MTMADAMAWEGDRKVKFRDGEHQHFSLTEYMRFGSFAGIRFWLFRVALSDRKRDMAAQ